MEVVWINLKIYNGFIILKQTPLHIFCEKFPELLKQFRKARPIPALMAYLKMINLNSDLVTVVSIRGCQNLHLFKWLKPILMGLVISFIPTGS